MGDRQGFCWSEGRIFQSGFLEVGLRLDLDEKVALRFVLSGGFSPKSLADDHDENRMDHSELGSVRVFPVILREDTSVKITVDVGKL